eukprot:TRINITY_DN296_c0_g3_i1.p1 TRINITY_DN296_c0_g3~~TRINITY_DN296_c0_g3_i1.p1  ORF type:complete len:595 (-),score=129.63 TRINITY_DN296_c0_g3_i1:105-1832(-)
MDRKVLKVIGDYSITARRIGKGAFSSVYEGFHTKTLEAVAVKVCKKANLSPKLLASLDLEISILQELDHPNVVQLLMVHRSERHIYLVMEYCRGGDLARFMKNNAPFSEEICYKFMKDIANAIHSLHVRDIVHRDLKPQNLLLTEDSMNAIVKLADFGFARYIMPQSMAETVCGSPLYMAPEVLDTQKYDSKADLWSLGTILYEMVYGHCPFNGINRIDLLRNIKLNPVAFPEYPRVSEDLQNLMDNLLQREPERRIEFGAFFAHPFFRGAIFCEGTVSRLEDRVTSPRPVGMDDGEDEAELGTDTEADADVDADVDPDVADVETDETKGECVFPLEPGEVCGNESNPIEPKHALGLQGEYENDGDGDGVDDVFHAHHSRNASDTIIKGMGDAMDDAGVDVSSVCNFSTRKFSGDESEILRIERLCRISWLLAEGAAARGQSIDAAALLVHSLSILDTSAQQAAKCSSSDRVDSLMAWIRHRFSEFKARASKIHLPHGLVEVSFAESVFKYALLLSQSASLEDRVGAFTKARRLYLRSLLLLEHVLQSDVLSATVHGRVQEVVRWIRVRLGKIAQ